MPSEPSPSDRSRIVPIPGGASPDQLSDPRGDEDSEESSSESSHDGEYGSESAQSWQRRFLFERIEWRLALVAVASVLSSLLTIFLVNDDGPAVAIILTADFLASVLLIMVQASRATTLIRYCAEFVLWTAYAAAAHFAALLIVGFFLGCLFAAIRM